MSAFREDACRLRSGVGFGVCLGLGSGGASRQPFPALCCTYVLQRVVHPRLIAGSVITGENRAVVVHLEFPAARRRVFVLIDVLNLVGGGGFTEIGCSAEEIDARRLSIRADRQDANVADIDAKNKRPK